MLAIVEVRQWAICLDACESPFHHARLFTCLNLRGALNLIRMNPDSIEATAFHTCWGLYECRVMPFGLTKAPVTFQSFMNAILHKDLDVFCTGYLDNILIS